MKCVYDDEYSNQLGGLSEVIANIAPLNGIFIFFNGRESCYGNRISKFYCGLCRSSNTVIKFCCFPVGVVCKRQVL